MRSPPLILHLTLLRVRRLNLLMMDQQLEVYSLCVFPYIVIVVLAHNPSLAFAYSRTPNLMFLPFVLMEGLWLVIFQLCLSSRGR